MISLVEILLLIITFLLILYKFVTRGHNYFLRKNIPHIRPFLWFNNFPGTIFGNESIFDGLRRIHMHFKNEKIYGMFDIIGHGIVIRDPEIIKRITIKDSEYFINHRSLFTEDDDPIIGNNIFFMRDEKWKDMRTTLSPAFTGNKIRIMFDLIQKCCKESNKYLNNELNSKLNGFDFDLKEFFTRLINDIIATSAFGIEINSLVDRENQFYRMGKKINTLNFRVALVVFLQNYFRPLTRTFGIHLFDKKYTGYFKDLVLDAMKYREKNNIMRPDMINILMEARRAIDRRRDWSDYEIVAQCFGFFMGAFENTSTILCFALYELTINKEIQERLRTEIDDVHMGLNGEPITYEILLTMKYLDMVVLETFRKWPIIPLTDRVCNKNYTLKVSEDYEISLKVGEACNINIIGLHHDPENFPNPEKFDPERFNEKNKNNIKPCTYLPFGSGIRNCIGNRFALMEIKTILYYLLSEFKFELSTKTLLPIQLEPRVFQLQPKGGFWLKIHSRN